MSSVHEWLPVQLRGCYFEQEAGDSQTSTSVRSCSNGSHPHDIYVLWMHSCGAEQANNFVGDPSNCTYGAKQPIYWLQKERNNVFEGYYETPLYTELYHYLDGAQNDIFENSTDAGSSSILPHSAPTANPTQMSSSSPSQGTQTSSPGTSDPTTPSASASGGDSYSYSGAAMPKASQPSSYSPPQGTPASSTGSSDPEAQYSSYPPMSYGTTYTESWAAEQTTGGPKPDKCPNK
jgi:hypothetical protein